MALSLEKFLLVFYFKNISMFSFGLSVVSSSLYTQKFKYY
jgi:hypothetical protein